MLGLAILFGLAVWCIVTLIAMRIGYKIGKQINRPKTGMVAGFTLTMGGWLTYWAIEFAYIQAKVSYLCKKEAGIKVYVTPEQWRKQIGEEEWQTLKEDFRHIRSDLIFKFNGKKYYGSHQLNKRLIAFRATDGNGDGIGDYDEIYVDKITNQVLFSRRFFDVRLSQGDLKLWRNDINDCDIGNWSYDDRFFHRNYTNYSITK